MASKNVFDTTCQVAVDGGDAAVDGRVLVGRGQLVVATDDGGETVPVDRVFDVSTVREAGYREHVTVGYESPSGRQTVSLVAAGENAARLRQAVFVAVIGGTWTSVRPRLPDADGDTASRTRKGRLVVDEGELRVVDGDAVVCALRDVERVGAADAPERLRVRVRRDDGPPLYELSLPSTRLKNVVARYLRTACGVDGATVGAAPDDGLRVLLVDDDVDFATLASEFIGHEHDNVDLETVTDPAAGLDRLRRSPPVDCVVSDYRMPPTNGIAFLDDVRELDPEVPFLLFTGRGDEEIAAEAIQAGVTDYIRKRGTAAQFAFLVDRITRAVDDS
jgi:CheY-like chemotaxis protein